MLECDYLVVGAGAAPMAFIDTLLKDLPESKVVLVDKKASPGGHWVDAYGYVRLHQPSIVYGIESKQLEGNWLSLLLKKWTLPWNHRADKQEILTYFDDFVKEKIDLKQIDYYPNCVYDFDKEESTDGNKIHNFSSVDGSVSYKVKVSKKLIDATKGENIIPHDSPLQFPVDEGVRVMTPNQIFDAFQGKTDKKSLTRKTKYVVLGAGKTGMDCIIYLQRTMKVDPDDIAWVISKDVWMMDLDGGGNPLYFPRALMKNDNDLDKTSLYMEKIGQFVRLDKNVQPSRFRFPTIPRNELKLLRKVKTLIRRGRATAIRCKYGSNVAIEFGDEHSPWDVFAPIDECVFVHATSPGPFNGVDPDIPIFDSPDKMTLNLLCAPPVSFSMSALALIETARSKGALDVGFMRRLVKILGTETSGANDELTENEMLDVLIKSVSLETVQRHLINSAILYAILDKDPLVVNKRLKQNRLSFMSIPGFKSGACDDMRLLCEKGKVLGLSENEIRMLELLGEKIKPLEGM
mmetsp:Transcript_7144/g.14599  ORF Transcript_7144/g.14599 Transcript_7144/m.14599 type:complete len:519 (+) Transcript_7144:395-1951(+)